MWYTQNVPTYYVSNQLHPTHTGGTAQGGAKKDGVTPAYITLQADCAFTNNECNHWIVAITSGTGSVAQKKIGEYVASTKRASLKIDDDFDTAPDATSVYEIRRGDDTINIGMDFVPGSENVGPFFGIQAALDVVASGEDIHVQAGQTYDPVGGVLRIKAAAAAEARIRMIGFKTAPGDSEDNWGESDYRVVVDQAGGATKCIDVAGGVGTSYLGYEIRHFRFTGATGAGVDFALNPTATFLNCRVDTCGEYGFSCSNNTLFVGCESIGNGTGGTGNGYKFGYNCTAIDCVAGDNASSAFYGYLANLIGCVMYGIPAANYGAVMADRANYSALVQNCTIDGEGVGKGLYIGGGTAHLANTIITRCAVGVQASAATLMATGICNLYYGNTSDRTNFPADLFGTVTTDPLFADQDANDYTIYRTSPAFGAGTEDNVSIGAYQPEHGLFDCTCTPRYTDMGYEFRHNESTEARRILPVNLVSSTDGSAVTGATPTAEIVKPGDTEYAAIAGAVSEIGSGTYHVTFAAADLDTLGQSMLKVTATGAKTQFVPVQIPGAALTLGPLVLTSQATNGIGTGSTFEMYQAAAKSFAITVEDADGEPVDLSAKTLRFTVYTEDSPTPDGVFQVAAASITVSGDDNEIATVAVSATQSAAANTNLRWILWDVAESANEALAWGYLRIYPSVKTVA